MMNPEFSRRGAYVVNSPYWKASPNDTPADTENRWREFRLLKAALTGGDVEDYSDLEGKVKSIFDRAEAAVKKANEEWEEFVKNDRDGCGRFHEVISGPYGWVNPPDTEDESAPE